MDYIQQSFADRIGGEGFGFGTELFKFEKIKKAKRLAMKDNPEWELIDLGVGEPDSMADSKIIEELSRQAYQWENRGYADNGIDEFKNAATGYMKEVYGVEHLLSENEILPVMGLKSALSYLPQAFINPGDITLMTVPGYPIIGTITEWLGGKVYQLPLKKENQYYPVFSDIPEDILKRAKLLYINYPNNPTGQSATIEFYKKVIYFAKAYNLIVIQDAAYAALTYGNQEPFSFLSLPEAKEVGIELHSLSKAFNMTGWRLGFACGNKRVISALAAVKDNYDSGQFKAMQYAGIYALKHPEITKETCIKYERRLHKLTDLLKRLGFDVRVPKASFYLYSQIPKETADGYVFANAEDFTEYLIKNALISMVPWDDVGHNVRISVTFVAPDEKEENRVLAEVEARISRLKLIF